jgi:hypothetical protein
MYCFHFNDLFGWLANETIVAIDNSGLDKIWIESKRKSFLEVCGTSVINYSKGSVLIIVSKEGNTNFQMSLLDDNREWIIDEDNGLLTFADLIISNENSPLQSEIVLEILDDIVNEGKCNLPTLNESILAHRVF